MISVISNSFSEKNENYPHYCVEDSIEIGGNKPEQKST